MADADASAAFELEDDSLSAGLDAIAAKFAAIATTINAGFAGANAQLTRTAASAAAIGMASAPVGGFSAGLANTARAAQLVTTAISGIVTTAARLAPWVKYIPDSLGSWVPKIKPAAAEFTTMAAKVGLVTKAAQALTGQLTVLGAGMGALQARELGVSRAGAAMGAAMSLGVSKGIQSVKLMGTALMGLPNLAMRAGRAIGGMGGAMGSLGRHASTIGMVMSPMLGMALALGPIGAGAMAVAGGFSAIGKSMGAAAQAQTLQAGFVTLLGSADAARARMSELSKFAASTPFEIPQVVKASKTLETLTQGALSTGAGLRMVGDLASISGQPFEDLSVHVGRLYDGLMNGRPVGEAMMRLQELGLMSSATRSRIEDLQKSGAKGGDVWKVAAGDMMRFSGEMERQSNTWEGVMSNIRDSIGSVFRAFGAPIITNLTPFMKRLQQWLESLVAWAQRAGTIFAAWSATIAQVFADGQMGKALLLVGKVAFMEAANYLLKALVGIGTAFMTLLAGGVRGIVTLFSHMTTGDFWKGVGNALTAAAQGFSAMLLEGIAQLLDKLRDLPVFGERFAKAADSARGLSEDLAGKAAASASAAGTNLEPLFSALSDNLRKTLGSAGSAFTEGFDSIGNVFDASGDKDALMRLLRDAWAKAKVDISATTKAAEKGGLPAPVPGTAEATGEGKGDKVGALQKLGLGGGIGARDPVVAATNSVRSAVEQVKAAVDSVNKTLTTRQPGKGVLVYA